MSNQSASEASRSLAYSYVRFSSSKQSEGDSLRRQAELRDAWLARNNVVLDTSLSLRDEGVSAFSGGHRENPDRHALATFLELVRKGRIARGSYLIVESLDRLTREDIRPALTLLLNLIDAGIRVVQLLPVETIYDERVEPMSLMMAIMELSRGHAESRMKSERVGRAWKEKKTQAASTKKPATARCPAWLELQGGKWVFREPAVAVVRRIIRMAMDGYGVTAIAKKLNAEGIEAIGIGKQKGEIWPRSTVRKILVNRALYGEYQPHTGRAGKRKPEGEPVQGYYPALITQEQWHALQAGLATRKNKAGRPARTKVNLWQGLLRDARSECTIHVADKGKESSGPVLIPYFGVSGARGVKAISFPAPVFEEAILSKLREINPSEILESNDDSALIVGAMEGKVSDLQGRIERLKAQLIAGDAGSIVDVLRELDRQLTQAKKELDDARQKYATPLSEAWNECKSLADALSRADNEEESRLRLRAAIRRITESIYCLFVARGAVRIAAAQLSFTGGGNRHYLIVHKPRWKSGTGERPAETWVSSLRDVAEVNLKNPEQVKELETTLQEISLQ